MPIRVDLLKEALEKLKTKDYETVEEKIKTVIGLIEDDYAIPRFGNKD